MTYTKRMLQRIWSFELAKGNKTENLPFIIKSDTIRQTRVELSVVDKGLPHKQHSRCNVTDN